MDLLRRTRVVWAPFLVGLLAIPLFVRLPIGAASDLDPSGNVSGVVGYLGLLYFGAIGGVCSVVGGRSGSAWPGRLAGLAGLLVAWLAVVLSYGLTLTVMLQAMPYLMVEAGLLAVPYLIGHTFGRDMARPVTLGLAGVVVLAGFVLGAPPDTCTPAATPAAKDWNERVWYQVFVRSFADGNGDGIGDLRGLTAKLDYLNDGDPTTTSDLGVGGIYLMPVMEAASYHGYDVTDYRTVEQDYGTNADFRTFLAEAHRRGIKVILDLVMNHTSVQHPWFQDAQTPGSTYDGWYVWRDADPGWISPYDGGPAWHQIGGRWYYAAFAGIAPDLNLRNPAVTATLDSIGAYWLVDVGVDGFRLDAISHYIEDGGNQQMNTMETYWWLANFRATMRTVKPDAMLLGEAWSDASGLGSYVPTAVDLTFDFPLAEGLLQTLRDGRSAQFSGDLAMSVQAWPSNQNATLLTNHDQDRVMSQLGGDLPSAKLAAFMLLTAPGTPFIYYGEEIGMTGRKPDERIRTPMRWTAETASAGFSAVAPWEPLSDDPPSVNVASQSVDPTSLLATYRDLIRVHGQHPALQVGATTIVDGSADSVIAWLRTTADETLLAVVNTSDEPASQYRLVLRRGPLCGSASASLVASTGGDPAAVLTALRVGAGGGLDGWKPVPVLAPRSGYLISLTATATP